MKSTNQSLNGTSYHDVTIHTTPEQLKKLAHKLAAEFNDNNCGEDKSNYDFDFETEDGDVFSVYDWKEYRVLSDLERVQFHIGAKTESISRTAKLELQHELNNL